MRGSAVALCCRALGGASVPRVNRGRKDRADRPVPTALTSIYSAAGLFELDGDREEEIDRIDIFRGDRVKEISTPWIFSLPQN